MAFNAPYSTNAWRRAAKKKSIPFTSTGGMGALAGPSAPPAPAAPSVPAVASTIGAGTSATADIRDPQYLADRASVEEYFGSAQAQNAQISTTDRLALERALRILGEEEPKALKAANEASGKSGLFYSSWLGKQRANIQTGFAREREAANAGFTGREALRAIAAKHLTDVYGPGGTEMGRLGAEALARGEARDQAKAQLIASMDPALIQKAVWEAYNPGKVFPGIDPLTGQVRTTITRPSSLGSTTFSNAISAGTSSWGRRR